MASIVAFFVTLTTDSLNAQESPPAYDPQQVPVPQRPPVAGLAKESYIQNCAPCHGARGDGDGPAGAAADPTVFSDPAEVWERSPAELFFVTKFGRIENLMPPWRNSMSDEQIWQVVYYAWNLHTDETKVAEGGELYSQSCVACHGEGGRGDGPESGPGLPDFSAQDPMIFLSQAELERRWQESHPEFGSDWSAATKKGVLEYIRSFSYQPEWMPFEVTGPGRITGRLFQGTQDGPAPPQTEVTLNVYQQTNLLTTRISPIGADGSFDFDNLPVDEGFYFLVETEHRNVRYTSPILAFSGPDFTEGRTGPESIRTTLPVFETTTDPAGLHVTRANWIIEHEPGNLLIGQLYTFGNRSGRTFTGTEGELFDVPVTLAVPLPEGAQEVEIQDGMVGEAYRMGQQTIFDTRPVLPGPGSRQIFVRYRLPYAGESVQTSFPVPYETESLNLLVADLPGLEVDIAVGGESLEATGEETVQSVLFRLWSAPVSGDHPVVISLRGLIAAGGSDPRPARNTQPNRELPISAPPLDYRIPLAFGGVVTFALLASLLLFVYRERTRSPLTGEQLAARREELIDRIARLDDLHALGELEEGAWRKKRAELKRELIDIALAVSKPRAAK
ncbi:MAG: c-type cytochrome [Caldilineaceae bacterium SB0675_bin_29]|uniref:C-type cytochrome n=1 Tax=Caldilineaceae bacterium SB0675_bin_29 TaxID=2605266 RepID=A0A6B1FWW5_9CHLR|nr:c-type cytochrome [Caldilineaceae bacterium SB0675_bin_29]